MDESIGLNCPWAQRQLRACTIERSSTTRHICNAYVYPLSQERAQYLFLAALNGASHVPMAHSVCPTGRGISPLVESLYQRAHSAAGQSSTFAPAV